MEVQMNVNSQINQKPLSKLLGEMSVLAVVQASCLGLTKLDREASRDSDQAHGAKLDTSKVNVNRMPGAEKAIRPIRSCQTSARNVVNSYTTRWGVDRRLLPNMNIGDCMGAFSLVKAEHDGLVLDFLSKAQDYINAAHRNLGSYHVSPPSLEEIENAFSLKFDIFPVPDISAYSTADKIFENEMKTRFEADIADAYKDAQKDALSKLTEPLENIVNRMSAYNERQELIAKDIDVGQSGTFKKTIMTKLQDVMKVFRSFNITGDPFLQRVAEKLDAFDNIEHRDLTKHKELRDYTAQQAAEIRDMLKDWL